ncbi:KAP family P-loop NTPase fold protein [Arthrobacter roseus]|uniref:KAP family P-loop NTPase fold protein n=1 Tax=Arthrobacter roseus TaxID=136274 RepID=UPI0019665B74|nr:P-loop NTPase fold protein [Arthrobacter roseus]MBM7849594.1 hypothetical protein [Arthrobacter roseus]
MSKASFPLWSDEPAIQDLLSFNAVALTAVDAVFDDALDPIALGLSGAWGSGKTSVLELIKAEIESRSQGPETKVLVISTQPWRYDPAIGPKESLISEVLAALGGELKEDTAGEKAKGIFRSLVKRINWSKAVKMAAMTSMTLQLPKPEDLLNLVKDGSPEELGGERGLDEFREDFSLLLNSEALDHISRVVVLVDDLDRCLPETVVDTLEAIRLFLSAKGMSFIIAADEDRVAEAIQQRLGTTPASNQEEEAPAKLYLHKIVQTTIPLPGLSRFDTQAYLFLLLTKSQLDPAQFEQLVEQCNELRQSGGSIDDLTLPDHIDLTTSLATASRLTPILYEKFHGNPRNIKRFLNDLNVRQAVASRRGIILPSDAVAKLMVLERLLKDDFRRVLEWLASNQLRDKLQALDMLANRAEPPIFTDNDPSAESDPPKKGVARKVVPIVEKTSKDEVFSDTMVRWAKLPPTLDATAVSGYLYLAASFARIEVIDEGLPERLRDIAAGLTSSLKVDRVTISDDNLRALPIEDVLMLIGHLGRRTRDQPTIQKYSVEGMLRIAGIHPSATGSVVSALKALPVAEIEPATALKLRALDQGIYLTVIESWRAGNPTPELQRTLTIVVQAWGVEHGN